MLKMYLLEIWTQDLRYVVHDHAENEFRRVPHAAGSPALPVRIQPATKKSIIADFINAFYYEHDKVPSVREIVEGTRIPLSTVHRYLVDMQEKGELSYNGYRSARTKEMSEVSPIHGIAVLGTVACGPGQEEEQRFIETIRMPETLVEKGDYFVLIAKGESMIDAGIFPGDYVFVKRQQIANEGDLVIALFDGKNNLKKLGFDPKNKNYILHSCNPDAEKYPDIIVDELQIQGVVKGSYHKHSSRRSQAKIEKHHRRRSPSASFFRLPQSKLHSKEHRVRTKRKIEKQIRAGSD